MKILVTGAAGFIGSYTAEYFTQSGHEVVGLDNINDYYDVNLKYGRLTRAGIDKAEISDSKIIKSQTSSYKFIKLDLENKQEIDKLFREEQFEGVCNLAAQAGVRYSITNPYAYLSSNIVGFMNILEACRHFDVKHLVYASSSSVYGSNKEMPFSVNHRVDHPISLYAATKKSNELMAHSYSHLYGIPTTGLRFFSVYGPWGRPDMALFLFTKAIIEDKPIQVFNRGEMLRDFTYVEDIVEGISKVLMKPPVLKSDLEAQGHEASSSSAPYKVYNIGNNKTITLLEFIEAIEKAVGKKAEKILLPMQPGDVPATYADVSSLVRDFGYKPKMDTIQGIENFVKWYREFYKV